MLTTLAKAKLFARSAGLSMTQSMGYHDRVIDHYEKPRNVGSLDKKSENVGTGLVGAPACGDVMKLQIEVGDGDVIEKAVFKVRFSPNLFRPSDVDQLLLAHHMPLRCSMA